MAEANEARRDSGATIHGLDWSQVRETVLMLQLAVGQIDSAMKEGGGSVDVLTDSFTSMAGYMDVIRTALEQLPEASAATPLKTTLIDHAGEVATRVQRSIIAFQFYDKLSQRLAHVSHSLEAMGELVADERKIYSPLEWTVLQAKIRAKYSTREEIEMFDAVMRGVSVKDALETFRAEMNDKNEKNDDVELF